MYQLLILTVAGTTTQYMRSFPADSIEAHQDRLIKEAQANIFPNAPFQKAYNDSQSQQIDAQLITGEGSITGVISGYTIVDKLLSTAGQDIRTLTNIGDWAIMPGIVTRGTEPAVAVTDVYKYIAMQDMFTDALTVQWLPTDAVALNEAVQSHLLARDEYYDQVYRDSNNLRHFFGYVRVGEDDPIGHVRVVINGLIYPSIDAAALAYNLPIEWVYERLDDAKWEQWVYASNVTPNPVMTTDNGAEAVVPSHAEQITGGGNPNARRVSVRGVVYGSIVDAVRSNADWDLTASAIHSALRSGNHAEIFYCDAEGNKL